MYVADALRFANERFEFSARRRVILPKAFVMFVIAPRKMQYMELDYCLLKPIGGKECGRMEHHYRSGKIGN